MAMLAITHLQEDETTLNNIARKLGTTKQSVKQIISILEHKDFVRIASSSKDKQAVKVIITEAGMQALLESSENGIYFLADLIAKFTSAELELMWDLLKKMYRYDGEEPDGFESEGNLEPVDNQDELQTRVMKEFERRRNQSKPGGGIHQYLFHMGTNPANPVLLFLHGGPGSAASTIALKRATFLTFRS